jgi:LuxR family maltose regulon positive regulatory protein
LEQLLTTKLYIPPLSSDIVPRPHLYERLDEVFTRKLTLVSAPTGFGKSTLVTGWISERDQPVAWLSLDQGDNDPVRFWTYLIAAIQTVHQETGVEARQIASASQLRSTEPVAKMKELQKILALVDHKLNVYENILLEKEKELVLIED